MTQEESHTQSEVKMSLRNIYTVTLWIEHNTFIRNYASFVVENNVLPY